MDAELTDLELRLTALIDAYQSLRMENLELAARVTELQAGNAALEHKLAVTAERVESIIKRLPAEES